LLVTKTTTLAPVSVLGTAYEMEKPFDSYTISTPTFVANVSIGRCSTTYKVTIVFSMGEHALATA